jgi:mannose-6-phosphate isomerase-like protein (cupin superfamily)
MRERVTPRTAEKKLAEAGEARYVSIFQHGLLELEYYRPDGADPQQPHTRDEVYFVISGTGSFVMGEERQPFGPGEVIFVPKGVPHHFEDFSTDFATWAIFAGEP